MGDDFYPPAGYALWWPLLGVGLLLLVGAWYGYVLLSTRTRAEDGVRAARPAGGPTTVQSRYLALIDGIEARHAAGTLTARAAHQELSLTVRSFVRDISGVPAQRMTLAELRGHQLPLVSDAVARFYPAEFGRPDAANLEGSADAARHVVTAWN